MPGNCAGRVIGRVVPEGTRSQPFGKLYINDYSNLESGGYDLPHINGYAAIVQKILDAGGPIDGIGLQSHFNSNLTLPVRVMEVLDQFAAFGKDLQVTEFDIDIPDEQIQADYKRDFLTVCFSHPAIKGFLMWGFWEGAHWLPRGAMIRKDWTKKPNYDVWNDLLFHQWWTDVSDATGPDGTFRARGFLGDYEVDVTVNGNTRTIPLTVQSNAEPAYATTGKVSTPERRHDMGQRVVIPKGAERPGAGSTPGRSPLQPSAAASSRIQ